MKFKLSALLLLLLTAALVWAQANHGSINGVVVDRSGAVIPEADVTAVNEATGMEITTKSGVDGRFRFERLPVGLWTIRASANGFRVFELAGVSVGAGLVAEVQATLEVGSVAESVAVTVGSPTRQTQTSVLKRERRFIGFVGGVHARAPEPTESYGRIEENRFQSPLQTPLSTFSIDVDTASYASVRRFLREGRIPPPDAVRVEELINYFRYDDPDPADGEPFSISAEVARCPWNQGNKLVRIGLRSEPVEAKDLPPANLVFLLDVSGSMNMPDKLPLLKKAFGLLVDQLRPEDRVSIVVYAGAAGRVLPPTSGAEKGKIRAALDRLSAGGSTAGADGIRLAYKTAEESFRRDGNNRVILATDGDFNVGVSSESQLIRLIESKRDKGIFLSVLGFGTGNIKDDKMEQIADHGNGNYAYVDSMLEARRQLVEQVGATLLTVAKDVKLQVEFNPKRVKEYRLVGYENRLLDAEDFDDDTKDAGEMGAGHVVTALYEIVPGKADAGKLRYQDAKPNGGGDELLFVKVRYKAPDADESELRVQPLSDADRPIEEASANLRFAAAVAEFGMLLRDSEHKGDADYAHAAQLADGARGEDPDGRRTELVFLAKTAAGLAESLPRETASVE